VHLLVLNTTHTFISLRRSDIYYIILYYIILYYITLHYITLHYITLHYITLHYIILYYIILYYIILYYIILYYILAFLYLSSTLQPKLKLLFKVAIPSIGTPTSLNVLEKEMYHGSYHNKNLLFY